MKSGIYAILNRVNGRCYIGSAVNIAKRILEHKYYLRKDLHRNRYLQNAWNKYGEDKFTFKTLLLCDSSNLIFFEQRVLDALWENGLYNLSPTAGSTLGVKYTDEAKAKVGAKSKGRWLGRTHTEEAKKKIADGNKGKNAGKEASLETRKKMSQSGKGRKFSEEHKARISASLKGKKRSPEAVEKVRLALTGRKISEETRLKLAPFRKGSKKGRKLSEATRAKMSLAHLGKKMPEAVKEKLRKPKKKRRNDNKEPDLLH